MIIRQIFTNHKPWVFKLANAEDLKEQPGYFSGNFIFKKLSAITNLAFSSGRIVSLASQNQIHP